MDYHSLDIKEKAFGGSVEITLTDGAIKDDIAVADAHPRALVDAGADAIFPEATSDLAEFQAIRDAVSALEGISASPVPAPRVGGTLRCADRHFRFQPRFTPIENKTDDSSFSGVPRTSGRFSSLSGQH